MSAREKLLDSRRLMGFATTISPEIIIDRISPINNRLSVDAANFIFQETEKKSSFTINPPSPGAATILTNGIADIESMVRHVDKHSEDLSIEDVIELFEKRETLETVAKHARFPEKALRNALYNNIHATQPEEGSIQLNSGRQTLQTTAWYDELALWYPDSPEKGCPVARLDDNNELDPLFVSFSRWASELSIRSIKAQTET